jgi:hypothetical protein
LTGDDEKLVGQRKAADCRGGAPTGVPLAREKLADRRKTCRSAKKLPTAELLTGTHRAPTVSQGVPQEVEVRRKTRRPAKKLAKNSPAGE